MAEDPILHPTIPNDYSRDHSIDSEGHEIRLLRILPGDDALTVSLVRSNLSSPPKYRALSYCWGSLAELRPISVVFEDDADVDVGCLGATDTDGGQSCHSNAATGRVREVDPAVREQGYLWIDMLCINQRDVDERSEQVGFMRSIYGSAESVVVWLGADPALRDMVFAPENYDIALANLAMEELGWEGTDEPLSDFVKRKLELIEAKIGPDMEGWEALAWVGQDELGPRREYWMMSADMEQTVPPRGSAFANLLAETEAVCDRSLAAEAELPELDDPSTTGWESDYTMLPAVWCEVLLEGLHQDYKQAPSGLGSAFLTYRARTSKPGSDVWQLFSSLVLELIIEAMTSASLPPKGPCSTLRRLTAIAEASPWFRRVWVIQEVASNPQVRIRVAEGEGSWDLVRSLAKFIPGLLMHRLKHHGIDQTINLIPVLWKNLAHWRDSKTIPVAKLLGALPEFSATDGGTMSLRCTAFRQTSNQDFSDPITTRPFGETYARFALAVIRSSRRLDVLSDGSQMGIRSNRPEGLPSWAPNFGTGAGGTLLNDRTHRNTHVRMKETDSWGALHVQGIVETTVVKVIDEQVVADAMSARGVITRVVARLSDVSLPDLWACVNEVYSDTFKSSTTDKPSKSPTGHLSLTLEQFFNALRPDPTAHFAAIFAKLGLDQDPQLTSSGTSEETRNEIAQLAKNTIHTTDSARMCVGMLLDGMCFFLDEAGNIGRCAQGTGPGDLVVALYGLDHLVILRPLEGGYRLVGRCTLAGARALDEVLGVSDVGGGGDGLQITGRAEGDSTRERALIPEFFYIE